MTTNDDIFAVLQSIVTRLDDLDIDIALWQDEVKKELRLVNGNLAALNAAYRQHGLQIGNLLRSTPPPPPDDGEGFGDAR